MISFIRNLFTDRTFGAQRSAAWGIFRKVNIGDECEVCGTKLFLQLHHKKPFWKFPDLELKENNVMTLCGGIKNCHLRFGHLGSWKSYNPQIDEWVTLIKNRP